MPRRLPRRLIRTSAAAAGLAALPLALTGGSLPAQAASLSAATPAIVQAGASVDLTRLRGNEAENAAAVSPVDPRNVVALSTYIPPATGATAGGGTAGAAAVAGPPGAKVGIGAAARKIGAAAEHQRSAYGGLTISVSHDGGTTWHTRVIAAGGPLGLACCDESVAFDRFGNLFLTYLYAHSGDIPVALSTDGGDSFHPLARFAASADQPTIATGAGSVWLTWTAGNGVVTLAGARVTGRGQVGSWSQETVPRPYNNGDYGDITVSPTGAVAVAYQQNTSVTEGPNIIFTAIDPDGLGPKHVQAEVPLVITNVGSFDVIPAQPTRTIDAEVGLAYDQSAGPHRGRLYAMWTDERVNESNNTDIWLRWSDNNGASWSAATRLNDDATSRSQFLPKLAVDQTSGAVGACWYDARLDAGTGGVGDTDGVANTDAMLYCTASTDGGRSFGPNVRVSAGASNTSPTLNDSFDYGDYEGLAFGGGVMHPAWSDNSNRAGGNPNGRLRQLDLYTANVAVR
ncbi:MAG: glycoside hydrolase [Actinomycetota bacterium]|nr:glycoside hydrolase [Actinomycetota bacterium]